VSRTVRGDSRARIRILSYNIHRAIGVDRRFRPDRIVRILADYDADLALLQEVDEGVPRSRELDLAREIAEQAGYPHVAVGHNVSLRKGRYGNATLSRHPIRHQRNIDLTIGLRKRRGCQHTSIRIKGAHGRQRHLEVFNLHLGLSARERQQQIGLMLGSREFADLPGSAPCFVAGDFNDWRSLLRPIFTEMLGFRSVKGRHSERPIRTYPSFFPRGALDRIYYRGSLRLVSAWACRMQLSKVASDHSPLIADFVLH
jgi:endonuclease/exonuclease/phosphatase family metal-dependent hydrolase